MNLYYVMVILGHLGQTFQRANRVDSFESSQQNTVTNNAGELPIFDDFTKYSWASFLHDSRLYGRF